MEQERGKEIREERETYPQTPRLIPIGKIYLKSELSFFDYCCPLCLSYQVNILAALRDIIQCCLGQFGEAYYKPF